MIEIGIGWLLAIVMVCIVVGILITTHLGANRLGDLESHLYHALSALKTTADMNVDDQGSVLFAKKRSRHAYELIQEELYE